MDGFKTANTVLKQFITTGYFNYSVTNFAQFLEQQFWRTHDNVLVICSPTISKEEEELGNSRSDRTYYHEPDTGETRQHTLQTLDEESTQLSSQAQPNPDQPVPPAELQESAFGEEELGRSYTTAVTRQVDGSLQDQIDDEVHEDHQKSDMILVKSVRQNSPIQPVKVLEQSTFCEGAIASPQLEDDKAAITQQTDGSIQVRIDDGAHENHHRSDTMLAESGFVSELFHILGNGVACVPTISEDIIEVISPSESRLLVTGRHGGQFKPKPAVHSTYHFKNMTIITFMQQLCTSRVLSRGTRQQRKLHAAKIDAVYRQFEGDSTVMFKVLYFIKCVLL